MDAILRKARVNQGVLVGDDPPEPKKHLDADTIAAFAENAVPPKAKLLYMEHFADCDRCRRMLSNSILLNSEAVAVTDGAASSVVAESIGATVPWYLKIFRTPNLALAMGALVLTFGGVLGYLVLQNRSDGNSASVAKVTEKDQSPSSYSSEPAANTAAVNSANVSAANSVANLSAAPNAPVSNPTPSAPGPSAFAEPDLAARSDAPGSGGTGSTDSPAKTAGASPEDAKAASVAPPPPPVAAQPLLDRDERKAAEEKEKLKDDSRERVMSKSEATTGDAYGRDGLANAKKTGPNRASGPRNVQQNVQQQELNDLPIAGRMVAPTRSVGGKTFTNRDGAWYDSAYHGQATSDYRRGTDEYKKLDGGLRKVADAVGGTVVLVWKSKAYRIQ
jgi:hypothetical protein